MGALRLYLRYVAVSVRSQMQYRLSFLLLAAGVLVVTASEFLGLLALFARFGRLGDFRLPEVALLYGMANASFGLAEAFARGFDNFARYVKSGEYDRLLLRPRSTAFQVAAQELWLIRLVRALQGAAVAAWAAGEIGVAWTPARAGLLLAAVAGGACVFAGLFVLQAALAFFSTETLELANIVTYGGVETAQYPLAIYRAGFRRFFTFVVPLACVNYLPVLALTGRSAVAGVPALAGWLSPAVGLVFLLVALRLWRAAELRYRSTGS